MKNKWRQFSHIVKGERAEIRESNISGSALLYIETLITELFSSVLWEITSACLREVLITSKKYFSIHNLK